MGLPGPANTQSAARMAAACCASSFSSPSISGGATAASARGLVPAATRTGRPTLSAKYRWARAETSAAFSWKA